MAVCALVWASLMCGSSYVFSTNLILQTSCQRLSTEIASLSLLSELVHGFSMSLLVRSSFRTLNTGMASLLCGSYHGSSNCLAVKSSWHTLCTCMASLLCVSYHGSSSNSIREILVTFSSPVWLLYHVNPLMNVKVASW